MELLLIRHCASSGQAPEAPLSAEGFAQAEALSEALHGHGIDAVYASTFTRAVQSVAPLAERLGLSIGTDERLRERLLSFMPVDDWLEHVRQSFANFDYRYEGGENLNEAQARGLAGLAAIAARGHCLPAVASHGNLIAAVLAAADPAFGFDAWRAMRNPDVFRLAMENGRPVAFERLAVAQ